MRVCTLDFGGAYCNRLQVCGVGNPLLSGGADASAIFTTRFALAKGQNLMRGPAQYSSTTVTLQPLCRIVSTASFGAPESVTTSVI